MITKKQILKELTRIQARAKDAKFFLRTNQPVNFIQDELEHIKVLVSNLEFNLKTYN